MNECPYFPFYARDWLTDEKVALMTMEQVGTYITLLAHNWVSGSIPSDLASIWRLSGANQARDMRKSRARFERDIWPALAPLFVPSENGRLCNKRMRKELNAAMGRREKLSESGKRGNEKRWKLSPGDRLAIASSSPSPSEDDNNPIIGTIVPRPRADEPDAPTTTPVLDRAGGTLKKKLPPNHELVDRIAREFSLGYLKASLAAEKHHLTDADVDAWIEYAQTTPRRVCAMQIQRFKNPNMIPRDATEAEKAHALGQRIADSLVPRKDVNSNGMDK